MGRISYSPSSLSLVRLQPTSPAMEPLLLMSADVCRHAWTRSCCQLSPPGPPGPQQMTSYIMCLGLHCSSHQLLSPLAPGAATSGLHHCHCTLEQWQQASAATVPGPGSVAANLLCCCIHHHLPCPAPQLLPAFTHFRPRAAVMSAASLKCPLASTVT